MERVFVVRRADFFGGRWPQGFTPLTADGARDLVSELSIRGFFVARATAEKNPAWKQTIPYCVIRRGSEIFSVRRTRQGGEGRLHGLHSVGLGGHIGPEDGEAGDPKLLERGLLRELGEELVLPSWDPAALEIRGFLNDDSNSVGRVHCGLVYHLDLTAGVVPAGGEVRIREISKLEGGFVPLAEFADLWQDAGRVEGWSRIVLEALFDSPCRGEDPTSTESD